MYVFSSLMKGVDEESLESSKVGPVGLECCIFASVVQFIIKVLDSGRIVLG